MRTVRQVSERDVWDHWRRIENHRSSSFRSDIRDQLPSELTWSLCVVEGLDVDRLYIISSDDWSDISGGTFLASEVAVRLDTKSNNADTIRIANDIRKKLNYIDSGGHLDSHLVAITNSPSLTGPFTLLEGNRRCVAFYLRRTLIGSEIFVGFSPAVVECKWARHTYRNFS